MGFFDRLFKSNPGQAAPQPDIRFGRYTDSYKTPINYQGWEQSLLAFEQEQYHNAYLAFFQYLRDEKEDNIRWWKDEAGILHFELYQGSKKIYGFANEQRLRAEAKIAHAATPNVGFMRRLIERNFILQFSRFAMDEGNNLCIVFDTYHLDGSPYKIYQALKELAVNADKQDDLLLDEFNTLEAVDATHLVEIPEQEKAAKYQFILAEINAVLQESVEGKLNKEQYPGGFAYLLLYLIYKLDYLIKPEGYMTEELERLQRFYFAKDNKPNGEKNQLILKDLHKLTERPQVEFYKEMYRVRATFGITTPVNHDRLVALIDTELNNMDWYADNGHEVIALAIPGFIVTSALFNFALPKPDRDLFHLYLQIMEGSYFKNLGMPNDFVDHNGQLNKKAIRKAMEEIVADNDDLYPNFNVKTSLDFDSKVEFAKSFLLMVRNLDLTRMD
jgi:hypothetical protein